MKAAVLETGGTLATREVPPPRLEGGDLLLRVDACGICGSDLHMIHSLPPGSIMGHEFTGEVIEVGEGVEKWRSGDRVVALPFFACWKCEHCASGNGMFCTGLRGIGLGDLPGAYAELVRVQPESCLRIPVGMDSRLAALTEPLAVGLHGVRRSRLASGDTCVIFGAGPIGLATLLSARALGANAIVSDRSAGRREIAARLGATATVDPRKDDLADAARALAADGPSVVFECVGVKGLLQDAMSLAPLHAEIVVLGVCMGTDEIFPISGILKELDVRFAIGYTKAEFAEALSALESGGAAAAAMITDVVDLDGAPDAFRELLAPSTQCKVLIAP
jgi:(R,R)-butanediol dehydrogenase/meso-butanediol dehydrogenase/diacetyl reductase